MLRPEDLQARHHASAKEIESLSASFDAVLKALTEELAIEPDVAAGLGPYTDPRHARRDLAALEAELASLSATAGLHERHAKDWENRAMMAIQEGRAELAKDALHRMSSYAEPLTILLEEIRLLHQSVAEHRHMVTTLEHEVARADASRPPLRWGLIGTGDIAHKRVAPALRDLPSCELVAVCRRQPELAEAFAKQFGASRWYAGVTELLADPDIDAVYIATPVHLHAEHTIAAANAGKHVLCEKPMAINAAECDAMIAACEANGVRLGVPYYRHFYPAIVRIRQLIASGAIGTVVMAQVNVFERFDPSPNHPRRWLLDKSLAGGGPMMDYGCHRIEMLINIFGPVRDVTSVVGNVVLDRDVEDTAIAVMTFERGGYATLSVTHAAATRQDTLEIFGSAGSIHVDNLNVGQIRIRGGEHERREHLPPDVNLHAPLIDEFADAVRERRSPAVDGHAGRAVAVVEDQIYSRGRP